jgi:hypothetical protein
MPSSQLSDLYQAYPLLPEKPQDLGAKIEQRFKEFHSSINERWHELLEQTTQPVAAAADGVHIERLVLRLKPPQASPSAVIWNF